MLYYFAIPWHHPGNAEGIILDHYELRPVYFTIPDKRKSVFRDDDSNYSTGFGITALDDTSVPSWLTEKMIIIICVLFKNSTSAGEGLTVSSAVHPLGHLGMTSPNLKRMSVCISHKRRTFDHLWKIWVDLISIAIRGYRTSHRNSEVGPRFIILVNPKSKLFSSLGWGNAQENLLHLI